jgi:hypothetical protein
LTDQTHLTRRDAIATGVALAAASAAPAAAQASTESTAAAQPAGTVTARGTVFESTDGSIRPGPNTRALPGILVSNGRDVVRTDANGRWSLPVAPGQSVFVIKPTGYAVPLSPTLLPRFAYLYEPEGTPAALNLRYPGVEPTGPLPDSIDFPLRRQDEPARFDVLLFTDPQPESSAELTYVRDDVIARAAAVPAAFGITTGDIMFDDLSMYARSNRLIGTMGRPWYHLPGNHDMNYEAPDNEFSRETFKRQYGARYYAFQHGGVTFFALDNVEYLGNTKYRGHFGERQLTFVRNVLANIPADAPVVLCFHIPLRTLSGSEPSTANVDTDDFLKALGGRANVVSFAGHTHTNEHHYIDTGTETPHHHHVLTAVSGSWWSGPFDIRGIPVALASDGAPNGFHILSIDGAEMQTRLVPAHDPEQSQLRLVVDSPFHRADREVMHEMPVGTLIGGTLPFEAVPSARLIVNLFDGGPRSKVEFAIAGEWHPMRKVERPDPFVQEVYLRNVAVKKPWVQPTPCAHLWQANFPADLAPGTHRVLVRAQDEHGREHRAAGILEIFEG